jgi:hypothetical protein
MLEESSLIVGLTTQHVTQAWLAKLWKASGCDFIYLEYEHGFFNKAQLADFVLACRSEDLPVVAKVTLVYPDACGQAAGMWGHGNSIALD